MQSSLSHKGEPATPVMFQRPPVIRHPPSPALEISLYRSKHRSHSPPPRQIPMEIRSLTIGKSSTSAPPPQQFQIRMLLEQGQFSARICQPRAERDSSPLFSTCLLYTSPSPRDRQKPRMPSSACKK